MCSQDEVDACKRSFEHKSVNASFEYKSINAQEHKSINAQMSAEFSSGFIT